MVRNRLFLVVSGMLVAALFATQAAQVAWGQASTGVVRVAPSGSNAAGCGSASNPCQTLQFAVEQLISGSGANRAVNGEVRIAAGTYTEGNPAFQNIIGIGLQGSLTIRGGYSTSNWNSSTSGSSTVLDGQGSRRGILITVPEAQAAACTMRIENLTIANGRSNAEDPSGGGILINNCKSVVVSNVTVRNSLAAGQSNTGNTALSAGTGGGISVRGTPGTPGGLSLLNVTLTNNQALGGDESNFVRGGLGSGGGLYGYYASVSASGLTINGNTAKAGNAPSGGGEEQNTQRADGLGGGIGLIHSSFNLGTMTVANNSALGGVASGKGGLGLGGGLFIELSNGAIVGGAIHDNSNKGGNGSVAGGGLGGGLFVTDSTVTIDQTSILSNAAVAGSGTSANGGGGGLYATIGAGNPNHLTMTNSVIANNSATAGAGVNPNGGGMTLGSTQFTLNHLTIANNQLTGVESTIGTAIIFVGGQTSGSLTNSIIANSDSTAIHNIGASVSLDTILSDGNAAPFTGGDGVSQQNVFAGNADFVDAASGDYRIGSGSDAINAASGASPTVDIEGQPRPVGGAADIGADEYQVPLSAVAGNTSIALSWEAPPGTNVTRYEIRYTGEAGANDPNQGASPINAGSSTSFNLTGLTKGAEYTITIVAYSGQSQVAQSYSRSVRTGVYAAYLPLVVR